MIKITKPASSMFWCASFLLLLLVVAGISGALPSDSGDGHLRVLSGDPYVAEAFGVLSSDECHHMISLARPMIQDATVGTGSRLASDRQSRTSGFTWLDHNYDRVTKMLVGRIAKLVDLPSNHAENIQFIRYLPGQYYKLHYDAFDDPGNFPEQDRDRITKVWANGGNRIITVLVYLNDDFEGGETKFDDLDLIVTPTAGKAVIFRNVYTNTEVLDELTAHQGMPVSQGEKFAFNLWFRAHEHVRGNKKQFTETKEEL